MKSFVAVFALVAVVVADVSHLGGPDADATIILSEADVLPDKFSYAYKTSNGISGQESGVLKNAGREDEAIEVQGSNSYTAPDGTPIQITYISNENGYQPQGAHLPTPPPIPDVILKSLEYIRTHPQPEAAGPARKF